MTTAELEQAEARYRHAADRYEAERRARNAAVRVALADGIRAADIARATGLSPERIRQILNSDRVTA